MISYKYSYVEDWSSMYALWWKQIDVVQICAINSKHNGRNWCYNKDDEMGIDMFIEFMLYHHNQNCMSKKLLGLQNFKVKC